MEGFFVLFPAFVLRWWTSEPLVQAYAETVWKRVLTVKEKSEPNLPLAPDPAKGKSTISLI